MKITSRAEALSGQQPLSPDHFTGPASSHPLHAAEAAGAVNVSLVRFEPGVRNHWHSHQGGQLLHVVEGGGWTQSRGAAPRRIGAGDFVSAAAGEVHWHGAATGGPMAHVAVSIGGIEWLEESPAPHE
ncbi:MAG: cupin domain-containing protein [Candidatus Dormibacteraceae bacterium]